MGCYAILMTTTQRRHLDTVIFPAVMEQPAACRKALVKAPMFPHDLSRWSNFAVAFEMARYGVALPA